MLQEGSMCLCAGKSAWSITSIIVTECCHVLLVPNCEVHSVTWVYGTMWYVCINVVTLIKKIVVTATAIPSVASGGGWGKVWLNHYHVILHVMPGSCVIVLTTLTSLLFCLCMCIYQAPLQRSLGTFAGVGCPKPAVYRKGTSVDGQ